MYTYRCGNDIIMYIIYSNNDVTIKLELLTGWSNIKQRLLSYLDLYLSFHNCCYNRELGYVLPTWSEFPRLERHVDMSILDQSDCTKCCRLEAELPSLYRDNLTCIMMFFSF